MDDVLDLLDDSSECNIGSGLPDKVLEEGIGVEQIEATVKVEHNIDGKKEVLRNDKVSVDEGFFKRNPPKLWMSYEFNKSLKQYESLKVSVGISVPVGEELSNELTKQIMKTYHYASDKITDIFNKEMDAALKQIKND